MHLKSVNQTGAAVMELSAHLSATVRIEAARSEWERILAAETLSAGLDHAVTFAERHADARAHRDAVNWYAEAGSYIQDYLHPIAEMISTSQVDLARRREVIRHGEAGWATIISKMQQWAYSCDTTYEPRAFDWPECDLTSFIQGMYPKGVAGFIADHDADGLRRPEDVDPHIRLQNERAARWQSMRLGMLLDLTADTAEDPRLRAMAEQLALGENIDEHAGDQQ